MQRKAKQRPFAGRNVLSESSFQLSVNSNQELLLLFITSPPVYSRKLAPFLNQSDSKLNPIVSWLPAFFPRFAFTMSSHWLLFTFSFCLIGRRENFSFDFYDT